ncbi:MAG: hypothetical protein ABW047_14915 [Nitrospiraceae bacterium]
MSLLLAQQLDGLAELRGLVAREGNGSYNAPYGSSLTLVGSLYRPQAATERITRDYTGVGREKPSPFDAT